MSAVQLHVRRLVTETPQDEELLVLLYAGDRKAHRLEAKPLPASLGGAEGRTLEEGSRCSFLPTRYKFDRHHRLCSVDHVIISGVPLGRGVFRPSDQPVLREVQQIGAISLRKSHPTPPRPPRRYRPRCQGVTV